MKHFNTGRHYGPKGQRIAYKIINNGLVVFADIDRSIDGYVRFQTKYGTPITEWSGYQLEQELLKHYDGGAYEIGDIESDNFANKALAEVDVDCLG